MIGKESRATRIKLCTVEISSVTSVVKLFFVLLYIYILVCMYACVYINIYTLYTYAYVYIYIYIYHNFLTRFFF